MRKQIDISTNRFRSTRWIWSLWIKIPGPWRFLEPSSFDRLRECRLLGMAPPAVSQEDITEKTNRSRRNRQKGPIHIVKSYLRANFFVQSSQTKERVEVCFYPSMTYQSCGIGTTRT